MNHFEISNMRATRRNRRTVAVRVFLLAQLMLFRQPKPAPVTQWGLAFAADSLSGPRRAPWMRHTFTSC